MLPAWGISIISLLIGMMMGMVGWYLKQMVNEISKLNSGLDTLVTDMAVTKQTIDWLQRLHSDSSYHRTGRQ